MAALGSDVPGVPSGWTETEADSKADGLSIAGTFPGPTTPSSSSKVPAVLLIAGSGPTDRNGNSRGGSGFDTLAYVARTLAADGVASLRYDKLGSGAVTPATMGKYLIDPSSIDPQVFLDQAEAVWRTLAAEPGVDSGRLGVFGHSEGGQYAMQLAVAASKDTSLPKVSFLGLLEPGSLPAITTLVVQTTAMVRKQVASGKLTQAQFADFRKQLNAAAQQLRTTGRVGDNLPYGISKVFPAQSQHYLQLMDRMDPATVATQVPSSTRVLLTCSTADIQVLCAEVARVRAGLQTAAVPLTFVQQTGVNHLLKVDSSMTGANYEKPLPFSPRLTTAMKTFAQQITR